MIRPAVPPRLRRARPWLEPLEDRNLLASLHGSLFADADTDGVRDPGEAPLAGRTVFLDTDRDGQLDPGERSIVTTAAGSYEFLDLAPGTYTLGQLLPDGWKGTAALAVPSDASAAHQLIRLDRLRADPRFAGLDGAGYTVAVLDTGITASHPAFADAIVHQHDFENEDDIAEDPGGHGTHVASLIASRDPAIPGVAPGAGLVALKVLDDEGGGSFSKIEAGLRWVIDHAQEYGIVCVNLSLGDGGSYATAQSLHGIGDELAALEAAGVVVVAAGGNAYGPGAPAGVTYPAADAKVLAVGAVWGADHGPEWEWDTGAIDYTTRPDRVASFTQRGVGRMVFAPGTMIPGAAPNGGTSDLTGSSMAAAVVAGLVPLAQQAAEQYLGRRLTPQEVRRLLIDSGVPIVDGDDESDNVPNTGAEYRRVDALSLIEGVLGLSSVDAGPTAAARIVHLANEGDVTADLGSVERGRITGVVFQDLNGDGHRDPGEAALAWRTVYIDANGNARMDASEARFKTGPSGAYALTNLDPGQAVVRLLALYGEVVQPAMTVEVADGKPVALDVPLTPKPTGRNRAPMLAGDGKTFSVDEDAVSVPGVTVQQLLGDTFRDADVGAQVGIAVVGLDGVKNGRWQFSLDGGRSWSDLGTVSVSAARLLRATDRVRFCPARDFNGTAALQYHAWDQTSGRPAQVVDLSGQMGGSAAFSDRTARANCVVNPVNDAPILWGVGRFPPLVSGTTNPPGVRVADLLKGQVHDGDSADAGLAVTSATGDGSWQFSSDGKTWNSLGAPTPGQARLLASMQYLRFVPAAGWKGTATLTYRAWDRSKGTPGGSMDATAVGGPTPFSLKQVTASVVVR